MKLLHNSKIFSTFAAENNIIMAEKLSIQDFGALKKAEIDNIGQVLFLIGESGSGKSTILKVLSMCRWIYKQQNIRCYLRNSGVDKVPFKHNINEYLKSSGIIDYMKSSSRIYFERDGVSITITAKTPFDKNSPAEMEVTEPSMENMCLEKVSFICEKRNILADLLTNKENIQLSSFYLRDLYQELEKAWGVVRNMELSVIDANLVTSKKEGKEVLLVEHNDSLEDTYSIRLEDASSGIQSSAPLDMLLMYYTRYFNLENSLNSAILNFLAREDEFKHFRPNWNIGEIRKKSIDIHIEEPEMCLFPLNQLRLFNRILSMTMMDEHPYVIRTAITTHSPYLLNYLNLLFKAYEKKTPVNGVCLDYCNVNVYGLENGYLRDLKIKNAHLVDPGYLSQPIDDIYTQYEKIDVHE